MRLDLLKAKLPVLLILVTLAISAMFMAQGVTNLLAGAVFPLRTANAAASSGSRANLPGSTPPDPKAILGRNAFDPSTGPLWPPRPDAPSDEAAAEAEQVEELAPGQMPPACATPLRLIASVHSEAAPEWSFASIAAGPGAPLLYRVGGLVEEKTVSDIFPNAVFLREGSGRLCSLALFIPPEPAAAPTATAATTATTATTAAAMTPPLGPGTGDGAISQDDLSKGIAQNSETKFSVKRTLVDKVLANQAEIMRSARIVPHEQNGQVLGVKLYGIRRNSLLGMLGLQNGDLLRTINGYDMSSPDSALEAYSRLRAANQITLSVTRRGQAMAVEYQIE